jgi:hypothetical protein
MLNKIVLLMNLPLLIGVQHQARFLDRVICLLEQERISGRKVMLEIPDFPLPDIYWARNLEFCRYFDGLAKYVLDRDGVLICGDSEELLERAQEKMTVLFWESFSLGLLSSMSISCEERDPHFLEVYNRESPDYCVLQKNHAEYLRDRVECRYIEL